MRTVALAGTDLRSSRLGFGLSGLHHILRSKDRQTVLAAAHDSGISYFDTSPYYGHGLGERELGAFANGRRHQILIATKFGIQPDRWLQRFPPLMYPRLIVNATLRRITGRNFMVKQSRDYSGSNAVRSLDRSLRALGTDHVDILYLHEPALRLLHDAEGTIDALRRLQSSGKVRYFGLAGSADDCVDIARRYRALGALIQVNAGSEFDEMRAAALPFHVSFGHFRNKAGPIDKLLASAVAMNTHGVILFSSRRTARIRSMARLLAQLDVA